MKHICEKCKSEVDSLSVSCVNCGATFLSDSGESESPENLLAKFDLGSGFIVDYEPDEDIWYIDVAHNKHDISVLFEAKEVGGKWKVLAYTIDEDLNKWNVTKDTFSEVVDYIKSKKQDIIDYMVSTDEP